MKMINIVNGPQNVSAIIQGCMRMPGLTKEEAETISKSDTGTWNISSVSSASTDVAITATNQNGWQNENKVTSNESNKVTNKTSSELNGKMGMGVPELGLDVEVGGSIGTETGKESTSGKGFEAGQSRNGSNLVTGSAEISAAWNKSSSYGGSSTSGRSRTTAVALSEKISKTYGYGRSYCRGEEYAESQGLTTAQSSSDEYTSSVTFSKVVGETKTTEWTTIAAKSGYHRWIVAGTAHVFGVVGYNMEQESFFVYTYTVMDDETHEFEDYSCDSPSYTDRENGVISFEIPYEVAQYVAAYTAWTDGLRVNQNSGIITGYTGTDNCVIIPEYMNVGNGEVVKITGISENAFRNNKNIQAVILSDYITDIPASAFNGCSSLRGVAGGNIKTIGSNAFAGCTSLEAVAADRNITSLGENAFQDVQLAKLEPRNSAVLKNAVNCGAKEMIIHLCNDGIDSDTLAGETLVIAPGTRSITIEGYSKTFAFNLVSDAEKTEVKQASLIAKAGIPLQISSPEVILNQSSVHAPGIALLLSAETAHIGLQGKIDVRSENGNTALTKNISLYESNQNVNGLLSISGKLSICGTVEGSNLLAVDSLTQIDAEIFERMTHSYTLTFNADGGICVETSRVVVNGTPIGELPSPKRDYYTFQGWYLADETPVTSTTVFSDGVDRTLYARWSENSVSDWVSASNVPSGAKIVRTKWTYTLRSYTESSSSDMSGWTKYDTKQTGWGNWSGWQSNEIVSSSSREVRTQTIVTGYNMITYCVSGPNGRSYQPTPTYTLRLQHGPYWWSKAELDSARRFTPGDYFNYANNVAGWVLGPGTAYCKYDGSDTGGFVPMYIQNETYGTQWSYRDAIYTYYYHKDEIKESTTDPTGQANVSNVETLVQYQLK